MYVVDAKTRELINSSSRRFKMRCCKDDEAIAMDILSAKWDGGLCAGDSITIGSAISSKLELVARTDVELLNSTIVVEIGVIQSTGIVYVPVGMYAVFEATKKNGITTILAYDRMATNGTSTFVSSLSYPVTVSELAHEIAEALGTTLILKGIPSALLSKYIQTKPEGYTVREVAGFVAACLCGNAYIDRNDRLVICAFGGGGTASIGTDRIYESDTDVGEADVVVGKFSCTCNDDLMESGSGNVVSIENPLMTKSIFDMVAANIIGVRYRPFTTRFLGDPTIDPSDKLSLNGKFNSFCMSVAQTFDGGLVTEVSNSGLSDTCSENPIKSPLMDKVDKVCSDVAKLGSLVAETEGEVSKAVQDAFDAITAVENLEKRADSGEFKGEKGDAGETGPAGPAGKNGTDGAPGIGITTVDVYYAQSDSATTAPTDGWQTTAPAWVDGKYIWSKTVTILTNGTITNSEPVCITGQKGSTGAKGDTGPKGEQGEPGPKGDDGAKGETGPKGDTGATGPKGDTGAVGPKGDAGPKGDTGATGSKGDTGTGVASITEEYYLSTSKTALTGGSWSTTAPTWSNGKYIWTRSKIVYSNPTSTSYTTPVCDSSWEAVNEVTDHIYTPGTVTIDGSKITAGTIIAQAIASGAIASDKIAANAVTAVKIKAGAVTTDKLAANSVTAVKIASEAITTEKLAANAVTADKIDVTDLFAQDITASGTITAPVLKSEGFETEPYYGYSKKGMMIDLRQNKIIGENFKIIDGTIYSNKYNSDVNEPIEFIGFAGGYFFDVPLLKIWGASATGSWDTTSAYLDSYCSKIHIMKPLWVNEINGMTIQPGSTEQEGLVKLWAGVDLDSDYLAATASAVKTAYDVANNAVPKSRVSVGTKAAVAKSCASGATTRILQQSLAAGTYIIYGTLYVNVSSKDNGYVDLYMYSGSTKLASVRGFEKELAVKETLDLVTVVTLTETTYIELHVGNGTGSAFTNNADTYLTGLRWARIK